MATLQVRDIDDRLYELIRKRAKQQHRSISQEVIHMIEEYLSKPQGDLSHQTEMILELSEGWHGEESTEEIIKVIRESRIDSSRFNRNDGLLD